MGEPETKQELTPTEEQSVIDKAELLAKRIEDANSKTEMLLKKHEEILSRQMLSGRSFAGTAAVPKVDPVKEKFDNEVRMIMSGKRK